MEWTFLVRGCGALFADGDLPCDPGEGGEVVARREHRLLPDLLEAPRAAGICATGAHARGVPGADVPVRAGQSRQHRGAVPRMIRMSVRWLAPLLAALLAQAASAQDPLPLLTPL